MGESPTEAAGLIVASPARNSMRLIASITRQKPAAFPWPQINRVNQRGMSYKGRSMSGLMLKKAMKNSVTASTASAIPVCRDFPDRRAR